MFQYIFLQSLMNFGHREAHCFEFQSSGDLKILEILKWSLAHCQPHLPPNYSHQSLAERAHSPSVGHALVSVHRAPAAASPAAVVGQPYPHAWPGRQRPLPFRSYCDHAASLSALSHHALPSHQRADRHCPKEKPSSKSLTSTDSSSSSCAAILMPSCRSHRPEELRHHLPSSSARPP
jgi:hypothetical protein